MVVEYESLADANFYCYFVKSGTPIDGSGTGCYTIKATPHFHRNIEFLFITKGTQKVTVGGQEHELHAGDILFVNSYEPHSYDDCDAEAYVLVLSSTYFEPFHLFYSGSFPQIMDNKEANVELFNYIKEWYEKSNKKQDHYQIFVTCNQFFSLITEKYPIEDQIVSKQSALVIEALKYINDHYCDYNLSLKSCSSAINYSKEYVSKQFNSVMGISFKTYVNNLRVKKYLELERNKKGSKQELAKACGFDSVATFYRALKSLREENN